MGTDEVRLKSGLDGVVESRESVYGTNTLSRLHDLVQTYDETRTQELTAYTRYIDDITGKLEAIDNGRDIDDKDIETYAHDAEINATTAERQIGDVVHELGVVMDRFHADLDAAERRRSSPF